MWEGLRSERGSQVIEFVAMFPLIIFAFLFIWQMALAAYTIVVTEAAARDGARVAAVVGVEGKDKVEAVVKRSASGLTVIETPIDPIDNDGIKVTVKTKLLTIEVPFINELDLTVTATAIMPYEGEIK